jgi:DNA-binding response OmpR family regulator
VTVPHLLVAENDPAISHVLKALLAHGGMSCDVVTSVADGLRGERRSRYAALIIDLGMPSDDGLQLIRSIRAGGTIPIVVLAGRALEEDKVAVLDAGADEFMLKPFFPGELLARIRSLLRRSSYSTLPAA